MKTALLNALRASVAAVAIAIGSMAAMAQEPYDVVNLIGKWTVEEQVGNVSNKIATISGFYLGDINIEEDDYGNIYTYRFAGMLYGFEEITSLGGIDYEEEERISDFWISNGNKLHILLRPGELENPALRFIIESWTGDRMVLKSYDGNTRIVVKKDGGASAPVVKADEAGGIERIYNLNGQEVKNPEGGLYIKRKGSEVKKVVVK